MLDNEQQRKAACQETDIELGMREGDRVRNGKEGGGVAKEKEAASTDLILQLLGIFPHRAFF